MVVGLGLWGVPDLVWVVWILCFDYGLVDGCCGLVLACGF